MNKSLKIRNYLLILKWQKKEEERSLSGIYYQGGNIPKHAFIDSCVIANWIILNEKIKENDSKKEEILKEKREHNATLYNSYEFVSAVKNKEFSDWVFYISELSWVEITHTLFKKLVERLMFLRELPLHQYESCVRDIKIDQADIKKLIDATTNFPNEFPKNLLKIKYPVCGILPLLGDANSLILLSRCKTQDAFLLSEAKNLSCTHFITVERRLPEDKIKENKEIIVINPRTFYLEFRKK